VDVPRTNWQSGLFRSIVQIYLLCTLGYPVARTTDGDGIDGG